MNKSRALFSMVVLLGVAMFTVQCTSPFVLCARFYSLVNTKRGECTFAVSGNQATCEANISQCSEADRTVISETLDCMANLEVCTKATNVQFGLALASCSTKLAKISANCAKAFAF